MSTRAVYTFRDRDNQMPVINVYKHCDGYPSGALQWITAALDYAWQLPRFEANDFAAAFIAANKKPWQQQDWVKKVYPKTSKAEQEAIAKRSIGGDIRMVPSTMEPWEFSGDAAFWYVIEHDGKELQVTAYECDWWNTPTQQQVYKGPLNGMAAWVKAYDKAA